jgi:hypothetical protein
VIFFLLCLALRITELLVIRTDQGIVGETGSNRVWAGMIVHFINNASVNLLHVVTTSGVDELQTVRISIAQAILFVAALALVLAQRRKRRKVQIYEQI